MTKKILSTWALALFFCGGANQANAAFYLRPVVQVSALANNTHADADLGLGGGLAWGGVFGRNQRFDTGCEITSTRFKGDFSVPTAWAWDGPSQKEVAWKKIPATCQASSALATFRYSFTTKNEKIRPFFGMAAGFTHLRISSPVRGVDHGGCWTVGIGGGVSYQLGRLTSVDLGYRYVFSNLSGGDFLQAYGYNFRYNANFLTLALTQRFGRGGR